jgi:hypothetical protein
MYTKIVNAIAELEIATETVEYTQAQAEVVAAKEIASKQSDEYYRAKANVEKAMGY